MEDTTSKPKIRFDTTTIEGSRALDDFITAMMEKLPYDQRHAWLLKFGWRDRGSDSKHHLYSHDKFWNHSWTYNQSRSVAMQCRLLLEDRGMVSNSVTERSRNRNSHLFRYLRGW